MQTILMLVITLTAGSEISQKRIAFESFNDCNRTAALIQKYVPGAKARCEWRLEDLRL